MAGINHLYGKQGYFFLSSRVLTKKILANYRVLIIRR